MDQKIIIHHISGSKINQSNEFLVADFKELSIGRNEDVNIRYDPEKDDLVSRRHAIIHRENEDRFSIKDEDSRNGTFVNKQRIFGTTPLFHGDIVQLGPGGPEFRFMMIPPPKPAPPPTREAFTYYNSKPTRVVSSATPPTGDGTADEPRRHSQKGRFTLFQESFSAYKKKTLRTQISIGAGLLGLLILAGGITYALIMKTERKTAGLIANISQLHQQEITELETKVGLLAKETTLLMSPQAIGEKFTNAVVKIHLEWKLTHKETNRQVYHQMWGGGTFPAYLDINGRIIPWLTTSAEQNTNKPIGGSGTGTGFSVSRHGLILTNRHVAAGATIAWEIKPYMRNQSYVFPVVENMDSKQKNEYKVDFNNPRIITRERLEQFLLGLNSWVPSKEQILVEKRSNNIYIVTKSQNQFFSRDTMNIYFAGDPNPMPGRLVRKSIQHNVALVTVDTAGVLPEVILEESGKEPALGEPVIILGYPEVSGDIVALARTSNPFDPEPAMIRIYNPTLTTGNMGRRINPNIESSDSSIQWMSEWGDYYQLTSIALGAGNSGGPVFNSQGRVVGVFFSGSQRGEARVTWAIPIEYGRELIQGFNPIF